MEELKKSKCPFEINWPLQESLKNSEKQKALTIERSIPFGQTLNRWFPYIGQFFKFSLNIDKIIYEKSEAYLIFVIYVEKLQALKGNDADSFNYSKVFSQWVTGELTEKHY